MELGMQFEVTGISQQTGDEQTLKTDAANEHEARRRAEGYGIQVTSIRRPNGTEVVLDGSTQPVSAGGKGGSKAGQIVSLAATLLFAAVLVVRMVWKLNKPNEVQMSPEEARRIREQYQPKLPAWAEDASREANQAWTEVRAQQAATQPATRPGGVENWRKNKDGQWERIP
jgi:hypothetical protein